MKEIKYERMLTMLSISAGILLTYLGIKLFPMTQLLVVAGVVILIFGLYNIKYCFKGGSKNE